ncbi:hypothetical protein BB561_006544 [Smittium simulii]|uniref:Alpha-mannosidase n=1 Tax=Smittium simulii TaxID=133385 RepID=A0A2T9Y371_9FUNG|nr:hypothetical protein BB561_006544 [Smittium simulii]
MDYNDRYHDTHFHKHQQITKERLGYFIDSGEWNKVNIYSALWKYQAEGQGVIDLEVWSVPGLDRPSFKDAISQNFVPTKVGNKFGPSWSTHWFKLTITVPEHFDGEKITLTFDPSCEGQIWSADGKALQGLTGGLEETRRVEYLLTTNAQKNQQIILYVETACNMLKGNGIGARINAPDENRYFTLETASLGVKRHEAWQLMYDMRIINDMSLALGTDNPRGISAMKTANKVANIFDFENPDESIKLCREVTKSFFSTLPSESAHQVTAVGNCHIDVAWMWTYAETKRKIARSFSTQLCLIDQFPEYKFTASQAIQFEWLEENYPELFSRVLEKVKDGSFIIIGGTYVEMDCNLPNGESMIRQFLLGQRYFAEKFGIFSRVFWLPDTFGYSAQIPQIVQETGGEYFFTQKISWNAFNKFPHTSFNWVGLDGSSILTHMAPADTYTGVSTVKEVDFSIKNNRDLACSNTSMYLYGYGDGGGGPNEIMIESLRRMSNTDGMPKIKHSHPNDFYDNLKNTADSLPTWVGELYFEFHRGTYTSQAANKKINRECEFLLFSAEYLATITKRMSSDYEYPADELLRLWKLVCLNQFHDVIPGSSIAEVYKDTDLIYADVVSSVNEIRQTALRFLLFKNIDNHSFDSSKYLQNTSVSESISNSSLFIPAFREDSHNINKNLDSAQSNSVVVAINEQSWPRSEVVPVYGIDKNNSLVGQVLNPRKSISDKGFSDVAHPYSVPLTVASNINGHSISKLSSENLLPHHKTSAFISENGLFVLQNSNISASFNKNGLLESLVDLKSQREFVPQGQYGNMFVMYPDVPLFFDAWDVEVYHLEKSRLCRCTNIEILDNGPLVSTICIDIKLSEKSHIRQWVSLSATSQTLEFNCEANWNEDHKLLKVEFCWDIKSDNASYETQFGYISRPTHTSTSWDLAKFEVCAHKYGDLSEFGAGVTLFNDSKYGYSCVGNKMGISLLRAPKKPDPNCDIGSHTFRFGAYPHTTSFPDPRIIQESTNFNIPLTTVLVNSNSIQQLESNLQTNNLEFFSLKNSSSVFVSSIKNAENPINTTEKFEISSISSKKIKLPSNTTIKSLDEINISEPLAKRNNCVIVRLYESCGGKVSVDFNTALNVKSIYRCDMLENIMFEYIKSNESSSYIIPFNPFEIVTLLLELN